MLPARAVHSLRLRWDLSGLPKTVLVIPKLVQCKPVGFQAQHCMSTGSWSGNFVVILEGLSSSGLCCDGSGDVTA